MLLCDLLQVVNENLTVYVWLDGERVAVYDGRDAIPTDYNNYNVVDIGVVNRVNNTLYIESLFGRFNVTRF